MARTNRFELVLSDEEFAKLEEVSKAEGVSKGAYVRSRLFPGGLDPERIQDVKKRLSKAETVKPRTPQTMGETAAILEAGWKPDKAYKQLVAQLQARMSLQEAEAEARRRLS